MIELTPKTGVVVTGGASGIGAACARVLAEAGRPVALWDLADGAALAEEIAETCKVPTLALQIDVTDSGLFPDAVDREPA